MNIIHRAIPILLLAVSLSAQTYERVLLPIQPSTLNGALNSSWRTILAERSDDDAVVDLKCNVPVCVPIAPHGAVLVEANAAADPAFLYVPSAQAAHVHFALRTIVMSEAARPMMDIPLPTCRPFRSIATTANRSGSSTSTASTEPPSASASIRRAPTRWSMQCWFFIVLRRLTLMAVPARRHSPPCTTWRRHSPPSAMPICHDRHPAAECGPADLGLRDVNKQCHSAVQSLCKLSAKSSSCRENRPTMEPSRGIRS